MAVDSLFRSLLVASDYSPKRLLTSSIYYQKTSN